MSSEWSGIHHLVAIQLMITCAKTHPVLFVSTYSSTLAPFRTESFRPAVRLHQLYISPRRTIHTDPYHSSWLLGKSWRRQYYIESDGVAEPHNIRGLKPGSCTRDTVSILLHDISSSRTIRRAAAVYLDIQKAFELVNM